MYKVYLSSLGDSNYGLDFSYLTCYNCSDFSNLLEMYEIILELKYSNYIKNYGPSSGSSLLYIIHCDKSYTLSNYFVENSISYIIYVSKNMAQSCIIDSCYIYNNIQSGTINNNYEQLIFISLTESSSITNIIVSNTIYPISYTSHDYCNAFISIDDVQPSLFQSKKINNKLSKQYNLRHSFLY